MTSQRRTKATIFAKAANAGELVDSAAVALHIQEVSIATERVAAIQFDNHHAARDILLLRLRALLARVVGDHASYRYLVTRYRTMADSFGFKAHLALAATM